MDKRTAFIYAGLIALAFVGSTVGIVFALNAWWTQ